MDGTEPTEVRNDDEWREAALRIARQLPRHAIAVVLDEVDNAADHARARAFRTVLVDHFNRLRPMKARRLFTSCFEPLLTDDPVLMRMRGSAPGLFQRADIGGLWAALTRGPLKALAGSVQEKLAALSRDTLVERVFATPEAAAMRATMAREAAAHLGALPRHRKAFDDFLAFANREALRDAQRITPCLAHKAPIDADWVALAVEVLREGEPTRSDLVALRRRLDRAPRGPGVDIEREVQAVAAAIHDIARSAPERAPDDPIVWLPGMMALHVQRRYDIALRLIRDHTGGIAEGHPLHWASFCHFAGICNTIADTLGAVFTRDVRRGGQPIGLTRPIRVLLRDALDRFGPALTLLASGGLLAVRDIGPRLQPLLADVARTLDTAVIPVIAERARIALSAREGAVADHEDLIWILMFMKDWGARLAEAGYATPETDALYQSILRDGEAAHLSALKLEPGDDPRRRMDHLVRIDAILEGIGAGIAAWANPMSQGMQVVLRHHLRPGRIHAPEVERIIEGYIAAIRAELGRSRHWQSAELTDLVALHEKRLAV
jgi:hypothetical protein